MWNRFDTRTRPMIHRAVRLSLACTFLGACVATAHARAQDQDVDPRTRYDVQAYRLDLSVDPDEKKLSGIVAIEATVVADEMSELVLDLQPSFKVTSVVALDGALDLDGSLRGRALRFEHADSRLTCTLATKLAMGTRVCVAVTYSGHPTAKNDFDGFHWAKTAAGKPWIATSCQTLGSSSWWPCKDSFFHPDDKPERVFLNIDVPKGLVAVSNGRLVARDTVKGERELFRWSHDYPCETYAIALNVAPYVVSEQKLTLDGLDAPLDFHTYVLPESVEKAKLQFQDVPRMLAIFGEAFGPFPFPRSKFALVETPFWGMEHSSVIAYGSSYPAWLAQQGAGDPFAGPNTDFDYILVHESAHEWWGNAVSAKSWGHFWIHEGFATYAEGVYLERLHDRARADAFFARTAATVGAESTLYRGESPDSETAYIGDLYGKGACVLNTLRHFVDDDDAWWKALRDFQMAFRYGNATTEDFELVLSEITDKPWERFFEEWFYGAGYPKLRGSVASGSRVLVIDVENMSSADTGFHVPFDLAWSEGARAETRRIWLEPGPNRVEISCATRPSDVRVVHLDRLLGRHAVTVR